MGKILTESLWQ